MACGSDRVQKLVSDYGRADLSVANELCDRHPADRVGYQIVSKDLSVEDLTYGQMRAESERVAGALFGLGVRPGDRVATLMGKSREYLATLLGIWRLGAVHVPLFTAFAAPAVEMRLAGSGAYLTRRRALGAQLYTAYGIDRSDYPARSAAMMRNFDFFGADVGVFFAMERALSLGSWLDLGAFMQTFMLAARGEGLETCPQQAWCEHGAEVRAVLGIPDDCIIVSGLALGYAETSAAENKMQTSRADVHNFARFME